MPMIAALIALTLGASAPSTANPLTTSNHWQQTGAAAQPTTPPTTTPPTTTAPPTTAEPARRRRRAAAQPATPQDPTAQPVPPRPRSRPGTAQPTSTPPTTTQQVPATTPQPRRPTIRVTSSAAPDGTTTLIHETVVTGMPEEVYAAFASADGWRSWAVPRAFPVAGEADAIETSYSLDARAGNPANIRHQFLARVPHRLIVYRTTRTPPDFPNGEAYRQVTSIVELAPSRGGRTRVRLTGTGYPPGEALVAFFTDGNRTALEQLHTRFATGPIDWAERLRPSR